MADQDPKPAQFPRAVYKRGTGKKGPTDDAAVTAESRIVNSEEELKSLGGDWVDTPRDALADTGADQPEDTTPGERPHRKAR